MALSSWGWLVDLMIEAAKNAPHRIVPDVVILVGDTAHGIRSGNFEQRYKLKRDRMLEIFGARTEEMLSMMAQYDGDHEYALLARGEAGGWLAELAEQDTSEEPQA